MQLNKGNISQHKLRPIKKIAPALAVASCSLLAVGSHTALARGEAGTRDFETAALFYSEADDRVSAAEPVFSATRNFEEGESLNLKAVFDALTGASPNGATPSAAPQTFSTPSGNSTYTTGVDEAPIDDTFRDTRVALSASWSAPINREWAYNTAVYGSKEYDYLSIGTSGGVKHYLNNKNTTLNGGLSFSFDRIKPEGDIASPLAKMGFNDTDFNASRNASSDAKTIMDALIGVTQVINRNTIMQFNYSLSLSEGYLNDPFKILSVIDDDTASANYGGNIIEGGNHVYLHEARPDSRAKHSLYWQTKYALANGDVVDGSYRFMLDDWGINSHTFDLRYRLQFGSNYLEPHLRYYMQSEADFYKRYMTSTEYNSGSPVLSEASSDYRVGDLNSMTVGLKYGHKLANDHEVNMRIEYYLQNNSGDKGIGLLKDQDLYPDTSAFIFQVGYSF